jgi:hypothetical protein
MGSERGPPKQYKQSSSDHKQEESERVRAHFPKLWKTIKGCNTRPQSMDKTKQTRLMENGK